MCNNLMLGGDLGAVGFRDLGALELGVVMKRVGGGGLGELRDEG